jgi:hypothetical protein
VIRCPKPRRRAVQVTLLPRPGSLCLAS